MNQIKVHFELSSKLRRDGRIDVYLRLSIHRKMKRIQAGVALNKADFNGNAKYGCWVKQSDSFYAKKNEQLKTLMQKAEQTPFDLAKINIVPTILQQNSRIARQKNIGVPGWISL